MDGNTKLGIVMIGCSRRSTQERLYYHTLLFDQHLSTRQGEMLPYLPSSREFQEMLPIYQFKVIM
jgi:hypothetical protein